MPGVTRTKVLTVTLEDCDVQTKRGHGKGGQNRNTRDTAVRVVHRASGAVGESQEQRSQYQNKRTAFIRMTQTAAFKVWLNRTLASGPSPEERVEQDMRPENLRVEVRESERWVEEWER
jgi:hypothetical protein